MSVKTIIQEAINKSPVALKEALEEELRTRVALALEAKMKDDEDEEDEDDDSDEDEDEDDEKCESVEQIDELSKKTLGSYIKAASRDTYIAGKYSRDDKEARAAGRKRKAGIAMAVDKLTKEEAEQIDEISSKTLGKYINKASRDVAKKETERSKLRDQIQKHNFSDWDADAALGHDSCRAIATFIVPYTVPSAPFQASSSPFISSGILC